MKNLLLYLFLIPINLSITHCMHVLQFAVIFGGQFLDKSKWEPNTEQSRFDYKNRKITNLLLDLSKDQSDNLILAEHRALKELQRNKDIVLILAGKGSVIVILDKQQYVLEATFFFTFTTTRNTVIGEIYPG